LLEQLEKFLKNRYTIFSIVAVVFIIIAVNVNSYFQNKNNEAEFLRFVEINDAFAIEGAASDLSDNLNLNFENFGYELIAKSILAKKSLDEGNQDLAYSIYIELYSSLSKSNIDSETLKIMQEQFSENILRLTMELDLYESGVEFINKSSLNSVRFFEISGDFYKFFENFDKANEWYNKAINSDISENQKNLIRLKLI
tara:strand:- start:19070 stop:19663 length:594 start_codon:yes stop_codon:yes gene_type:complete